MNIQLVMTVICKDRPGIVESIAEILLKHKGNWLESRMCRLGGEFAGIVRVELPPHQQDDFINAIESLSKKGLNIIYKRDTEEKQLAHRRFARLEIIGQDRPGIVYQISRVLAENNVNVEELSTECVSAPMSGEPLFKATVKLGIPDECNLDELKTELEKIGNDLMVDTTLQEENQK